MQNNEFSVASANYFNETGICYQANSFEITSISDLSSTGLFKLDWTRLIKGGQKVKAVKSPVSVEITRPVVVTEKSTAVTVAAPTVFISSTSPVVVPLSPTVLSSVGNFMSIFRYKLRIRTRVRRAVAAFLN